MSVNGWPRDDFELREKYMKTSSTAYDKRKKEYKWETQVISGMKWTMPKN